MLSKWIFLGDDSRRIFISKLLRKPLEEISEDKSLILRHGENLFAEKILNDENLIYTSYHVPPDTEIFLPAYSTDMNISEENFDNCAIFEMYPFAKESTENFAVLLEKEQKNYPAILFVMMDIVAEDEDSAIGLDSVRKIYLRKNRDIIIYREESDLLKVLHWHKPLGSDIVNLIRRELKEISVRFDDIYSEYENFLEQEKISGSLSAMMKNRIVSFDSVKRQSLIWMSYKVAARKVLFTEKNCGVQNLFALYCKILFDSKYSLAALIWNVQAECNKLSEKLQQRFEKLLQTPKKFQAFLNAEETYSEHMYRSLIRPGGRFGEIDKVFLAEYEKFLQHEVRKIFVAELDSHIKDLKNILDERRDKLS